jgi:hypothetical protein
MPAAVFPWGLVVDAGYSYQFDPASYLFARTLFLEARSKINEMSNMHDQARFGLGIRFRF